MGRTRKRFSEDFKREAVNLLLSSGKTLTDVSRELGIELYNLARWKNEFLVNRKDETGQVETPAEKLRRLEKENAQLQRENAVLRQERDILKKSLGIVSKQ